MIPINVSLSHYKRKDIQEGILDNSNDREVAVKFNESFGKRPDTIRHPNDILELAKQGATSFHASEELWSNPLQLDPSLKRIELDKLRIGWDLILDIDCGLFEYSKIAADLVIKALKFHKIMSVSCKFSGNKGFHIGVPYEAFPEKINDEDIKLLFPQVPRRIALYIREMIKKELGARIMEHEKNNFDAIISKTGKNAQEITYMSNGERALNAEPFLTIDTLLISSRHLYRMPYSLHEKSGLVSMPLDPQKVTLFEKELAFPKNAAVSKYKFLDKESAIKEEAKQLLIQAYDFGAKQEIAISMKEKIIGIPQKALPQELFPPCVKLMLNGVDDGRKRALFVLVNYLVSIGWDYDLIGKTLTEWNKRNKEPLRDVYIEGQLRYSKQMGKKIFPPNCSNKMYMAEMGVCKPDNFCPKIKNPAQYTTKKAWLMGREGKSKTKD